MRIGIDARMYRSSVAGIGRYSKNLIQNLLEIDQENQYVFFFTPEDKQEFEADHPGSGNYKIITTEIPHYSLAEQRKLSQVIEKEKLDLVHFLNFNFPVRYRGKFITTIHDLTLFYFPSAAKKTNFIKQFAFRYTMKKACQNSAAVIAVSKNTKKDVVEKFGVSPEKVTVIYEAADDKSFADVSEGKESQLREKYHIDKPVILYVGQFRPHKNVTNLVKAFEELRRDTNAKLVLIGKMDPAYQELRESIDKSPQKSDIVEPGFVSNEDLATWYKLAKVFVFPSLYEGFGLPGLEAMASGTPVVSSGRSCLPEIYRDAACYFDPSNPVDMAAKIRKVLTDENLRTKLIERGKAIAANYSWRKTAEQTLNLYLRVGSQQ